MFKDKITAVIGGGNAGFEAALGLASYCPKVYILEVGEKVLADEINQERAEKSKKIEIIYNAKVKEIKGGSETGVLLPPKGKNFVNSLIYQDQVSKADAEISLEGIFIEIGSIPATGFVKELVDFNDKDEIKTDANGCVAKTPGLFSAGDVTDAKYKQIIIATGEGAKAALSAYEYLQSLK